MVVIQATKEGFVKFKNMTKVIRLDEFKNEEWAEVQNFPSYLVSKSGLVLNRRTLCVLKPADNGNGYKFVNLSRDGVLKLMYVHRLVMMSFCPIENMDKHQVDHEDFNRSNNSLKNLSWASGKDNKNRSRSLGQYDAADLRHSDRVRSWVDNGTHNTVKLTPEKVLLIRDSKLSAKTLSAKYGVCVNSILNVKSRKTWSHI